MAEWDLVECGFNIADETINFGARSLADGGNLYEAVTLASIKNSFTSSNEIPDINALIKKDKILFKINKSMRIFDSTLCTNICFNAVFEDIIDAYIMTLDGNFLLICLRSGIIHFVKLGEDEIIFSSTYCDNEVLCSNYFVEAFLEFENDSVIKFLLVIMDGKIIRLTIDKTKITTDCENLIESNTTIENNIQNVNGNGTLNESIQKSIINSSTDCYSYETIKDFQLQINESLFLYPYLLISGTRLISYNIVSNKSRNILSINIKKIIACIGFKCIALTTTGELFYICVKTLQYLRIDLQENIKNCTFISNKSCSECFLYVITEKTEVDECYMKLIRIPGKLCFKFVVKCNVTSLYESGKCTKKKILFFLMRPS